MGLKNAMKMVNKILKTLPKRMNTVKSKSVKIIWRFPNLSAYPGLNQMVILQNSVRSCQTIER